MDGVGLNAARNTTGIPFEIPPRIPPQWFVFVTIFPFSTQNGSLFSLPRSRAAAKPAPNSTPLTAGMANTVRAMRFSSPQTSDRRFPPAAPLSRTRSRRRRSPAPPSPARSAPAWPPPPRPRRPGTVFRRPARQTPHRPLPCRSTRSAPAPGRPALPVSAGRARRRCKAAPSGGRKNVRRPRRPARRRT